MFVQFVNAQCTFTASGVETNITCYGGNNGAINITSCATVSGPNPVAACLPQYGEPCGDCPTTWDHINNFYTIGACVNISKLNSHCNGAQPNNYSYNNQSVTAKPGTSFTIKVQCSSTGCASTYAQAFGIWVDWNNDGDFNDANENCWNSGTSGFQLFTGTINVPANATCGKKRMRVRCTYAQIPATPCGYYTYGETEDYNVMVGAPLTYLWSNGATTEDISNLTAGPYSVTITSGLNDTIINFNITEPVQVAANITAGGDTSYCAGSGVELNANIIPGCTYSWSNGDATDSTFSNAGGIYSVTITNANGCSSADSINTVMLLSPTPPQITPADSILLCANGSVVLTSNIISGIIWQPGGQTTASITVNAQGNYFVEYVDINGCSSASAVVQIISVPNPVAAITPSGSTTFCIGNSVNLSSGYPSGNLWSNGATTQSITVLQSGIYFLTVSGIGGCTDNSPGTQVIVHSLPVPQISASGNTTFCEGNAVTLTSNFNSGNIWSDGTTSNQTSISSSSSVTLTVTDANGCSAVAGPLAITVNPTPTPPVISPSGYTTFCSGSSLILTSSYNSGNLWTPGGTNNFITVTTTGNYSLIYTDANGCSSLPASVAVTVNQTPTASFNMPTGICFVDNATITYSGNAPATAQYNWNFDGGTIISGSGQGTYSIHFPLVGNYSISLQVINNGCSSILNSQPITVNPNPTANFILSDNDICSGDLITATYTGNAAIGSSFFWSYGTGINISGAGVGPVTAQFIAFGTTAINLTVKQGTCTSESFQVLINVNPLPVPNIIASNIQACDSLNVLFSTLANANNYLWQFGDGETSTLSTPSHLYYSGAYNVSLSLIDSIGCAKSVSDSALIHIYPTPIASFVINPMVVDSIDLELANFTFNNTSKNTYSNHWDFGDGNNSASYSPSHSYNLPGHYQVQLIAINQLGCSDTAAYGPFIISPAAITYIPNMFTPNNDGVNDIFRVYSKRIKEVRLIIYDRTGELIFESNDMLIGWDGRHNGKASNTGVYVYYCKVIYDNLKEEELFGDVTLVR